MARKNERYTPVFGGFIPLAALWDEGVESGPLFPSESAARWFIRAQRTALVEAEAIAVHCGRMLIHPVRVQEVAQRVAFAAAQPHAQRVAGA